MKNKLLHSIQIVFVLYFTLSFSITSLISCGASYPLATVNKNTLLHTEEIFIDWDRPKNLNTPFIYTTGIITVDFTNLISSVSNVTFSAPDSGRYEWIPIPINVTLQPGEQYTETFNLTRGIEGRGSLSYGAAVPFIEGNNATILFGYNIIFSGTSPASLPFSLLIFSFSATTLLLLLYRRKHGRN